MPNQVEGTALHVTRNKEVLRFRLDIGQGQLLPVEMRGEEVRGDLLDGEKVALDLPRRTKVDVAVSPKRILNLSTGYEVRVWQRSRLRRITSWITEHAVPTAISAAISAAITAVLKRSLGVGATGSGYFDLIAIVAVLLILLDVVFWVGRNILSRFIRQIPPRRKVWSSPNQRFYIAILVGFLIGDLLVTTLQDFGYLVL